MSTLTEQLEKLDAQDRKKAEYFISLLLRQAKYAKLRKTLDQRRREIQCDETLPHETLWKDFSI